MEYYHDLITQKSWELLKELKTKYSFVLIGGWAVFLHTKALKSKDIDLVLEFPELEKIRKEFGVSKNDRLKKYEAKREGMEIDIYIPHYSNPGLPAEELERFTVNIEGFKTVTPEVLAILKQKALIERRDSVKGRKDLVDLVGLFRLEAFDQNKYKELVSQYGLTEDAKSIATIIKNTKEIEELDLNAHKMSRLKKEMLSFLN